MFNSRKRRTTALAVLAALGIAAGAIAYWTVGGSGTGTATTVSYDVTATDRAGNVSAAVRVSS